MYLRKVGYRNLDLALLEVVTVIKDILEELGNPEYVKKGRILNDHQNIKKGRNYIWNSHYIKRGRKYLALIRGC